MCFRALREMLMRAPQLNIVRCKLFQVFKKCKLAGLKLLLQDYIGVDLKIHAERKNVALSWFQLIILSVQLQFSKELIAFPFN
jgi:hypothetical protein